MNTKINLKYKGEDYTLEYDRYAVKLLENNNFVLQEFFEKPLSNVEMAFAGAFIKNHKKVKQEIIDEIYESCPDKQGLIKVLYTMISETYDSLFEEKENKEGNATWEVSDLKPSQK